MIRMALKFILQRSIRLSKVACNAMNWRRRNGAAAGVIAGQEILLHMEKCQAIRLNL